MNQESETGHAEDDDESSKRMEVKSILGKIGAKKEESSFGLTEVLQLINWDYVTLSCIIDCIKNYTFLRSNLHFQKTI